MTTNNTPNATKADTTSHDPKHCVCKACHRTRMAKPEMSIGQWCAKLLAESDKNGGARG